jgi:hypothetical protein
MQFEPSLRIIPALLIHQAPKLLKQLRVVITDFVYHMGKQKWPRHIQTEQLAHGTARKLSLSFRHRVPSHVLEGHDLRSLEGDPVDQTLFPQSIKRCHYRDVSLPDVGAVAKFPYRDAVRLLPDSGQESLFQRAKPDLTRC